MSTSPRIRLQIDATQRMVDELDATTELIGATSRSETLRRASDLLGTVVHGKQEGRVLCFRNPDGTYTEIIVC